MKYIFKISFILLTGCLWPQIIKGQETIAATGGTSVGTGGSVTYTTGQVVYSAIEGAGFSIIHGVQQPYEISVITAIKGVEDITLECLAYPNPTSGTIRLVIKSSEYDNMWFRLYDINGLLLQDKKIEARETEINMGNLTPAIYFLKVTKNKLELKTFKIVKK